MNTQERKAYTREAESFYMSDFWIKRCREYLASLPGDVEALPIPASGVNLAKGEIFDGRKLARPLIMGSCYAIVENV